MNIMIVDDNLTSLKLIRAQLEAEGNVVTEAHDGVEALERLDQNQVDAVISDILMPRMDGYRLCQEIRRHEQLRNLPTIIYSSTFTSEEDVKLALDVGTDKYVSKPASIEVLVAALKEVMAKPHAAAAAGALPAIEVLKEYSQRLVGKLAEKTNALERANATLSTTRDQLAHLIRHSPAVLYSLKVEGGQVLPQMVSENVTRLLGVAVEDACAPDWRVNHLHPEDRERALAGLLEVVKAGTWTGEYRLRHQAGHYLWMEDQQQLVRDAEGRPAEIVGVWTNITRRKQAEDSLRESEERFRQLAENINEVFWITDATMHQMIYVSPAYEKIWGRTCASLHASPRQWLEMIHPDDGRRVAQAAADVLTSGRYDATYRILRPDKTERWIHDKGFPIRNAAGEVHRIVGTAEDITEQRTLAEQLRQRQKMESMGQLAGGIAHDFNNILSAIVLNLYLAKTDAAGQPEILDSLENIAEASARATDLVNQILTFSRQTKPERTPVKLNDVVIEALKLLRASLPATIRIETSLTKTATVLANSTAIHQVIMNLGTNAWHAMRDQTGLLKMDMNVLEADEDFVKIHPDLCPGWYVQLSVSDTGCGMDAATLEHIFEPFFTTKGVGEGTGLGLAVVHGIMKSHDGGITVYSQPGKGTRFHLYFPVIETEMLAPEIEVTPLVRGHGGHILFVDDEAVLASVGKRMLERLGYLVTTKTDPLKAIAAVRDQPETFDLVITDLTMPGMDGIKLGSQLLQMQPGLPIIMMSGYSGTLTAGKVRELGFRELLSKPCTARALAEAVNRALQPTGTPKT